MPFGKYRAMDLSDLPTHYLKWVEENLSINQDLRDGINHEIERREGERSSKGRVIPKGKEIGRKARLG